MGPGPLGRTPGCGPPRRCAASKSARRGRGPEREGREGARRGEPSPAALGGGRGAFDGGRLPQPQLSARIAAAASSARPPSLPPPPRPPAAPAAPREPRCESEVPLLQRDPRPQPPPVIFGSSQHGARRAERGDAAGETRTLRRRLRHPRSRSVTRRRPARHHGACRRPGPTATGAEPPALRGPLARPAPSGSPSAPPRSRSAPAASPGAAPRGLRRFPPATETPGGCVNRRFPPAGAAAPSGAFWRSPRSPCLPKRVPLLACGPAPSPWTASSDNKKSNYRRMLRVWTGA